MGSVFGGFPETLCRVDAVIAGQIALSIGETRMVVSQQMANILERNLPEPESWLECEVAYIREMAERCNCKDCRANLVVKEAQLAAERSGAQLVMH